MSQLIKIIPLVYFIMAVAMSIPLEDSSLAEEDVAADIIRPGRVIRPRPSFNLTCAVGQQLYSINCTSSDQLIGSNSSQYVYYGVRPLNSTDRYPKSVLARISYRRSLTCCSGVGGTPNGTVNYQFVGCGYGHFGGLVYWGNFTGSPGITCRSSPNRNSTVVAWRYSSIHIGDRNSTLG